MRVLKITFNELLFNLTKKILLIILITIFISQSAAVLSHYDRIQTEKASLEQSFGNKMILRLIPNSGFSQESLSDTTEIFSAVQETFGDDLYYFNYINPMSPQFFSMTNARDAEQDFYQNNEIIHQFYQTSLLEINEQQYRKLSLVLDSGSDFKSKDFIQNNHVIILGHAYQALYQIGDKISLTTDQEVFSDAKKTKPLGEDFTVIGFLKEGQQVFDFTQGKSDELNLNKYIVFPTSFEKMNKELLGNEVPIFSYAQGIYAIKDRNFDLFLAREQLNKALSKNNLPMYFKIQDDKALFTSKLQLYEDQLFAELIKLIMVFLFLLICLFSIIRSQISQRSKYFIIYYLIGMTLNEIKWSYFFQLMITYLFSFMSYCVYYYFTVLLPNQVPPTQIFTSIILKHQLLIVTVYCILSLFIIMFSFRKLSTGQLSQLIKGEKL